jgi:predicted NBD/HSP70 family sugar kinase
MAKTNKNLVLGVDVGGSKINMVVWNGKKVIDSWQTDEVTLKKLKEGISSFNIPKVGIAMAAVLDFKTGKVLNSPNLESFKGVCLKNLMGRKVRFDNDVHCFLKAEAEFGTAKGYKNVLAVAMGTGIGGAVMTDKKVIYPGGHGSAGEFGFMVLQDGKTWEKLYHESNNNAKAQEQIHALGFANLINAFDPEVIILGGGGAKMPNRELMENLILSPLSKKTKIISGKLGKNANAIGATLLWSSN